MRHESRTLLLALLAASLALAGCTGGDDEDPADTTPVFPSGTTPAGTTPAGTNPATATPAEPSPVVTTPDAETPVFTPYTLDVSGLPQEVEAGMNFTFVLRATGGTPGTSDHLGAHYGNLSAAALPANTTTYPRACQHVTTTTDVPGTYNVTCAMPSAGTWYLRGHVLAQGNHSWGNEMALTARPAWTPNGTYTLNLTGVPTVVPANQNVTMNLTMTGPSGISNHFGAHYGRNATGTPSLDAYPQACVHVTALTPIPPGSPTVVTCNFSEPGTYYLRGHLRVDEGLPPAPRDHWTSEHVILVL